MRRSFRGPRVIVPKANEKVAFGARPKLTNVRLYLLSHEELLTQDSGSIVAPDRFRNGPVSVPFHQAKQTLIDPLHGAGPLVNKARVNLHRAGAGFDFLIGVFGA